MTDQTSSSHGTSLDASTRAELRPLLADGWKCADRLLFGIHDVIGRNDTLTEQLISAAEALVRRLLVIMAAMLHIELPEKGEQPPHLQRGADDGGITIPSFSALLSQATNVPFRFTEPQPCGSREITLADIGSYIGEDAPAAAPTRSGPTFEQEMTALAAEIDPNMPPQLGFTPLHKRFNALMAVLDDKDKYAKQLAIRAAKRARDAELQTAPLAPDTLNKDIYLLLSPDGIPLLAGINEIAWDMISAQSLSADARAPPEAL